MTKGAGPQGGWGRFRSHRASVIGGILVVALVVAAASAPLLGAAGWISSPSRLDLGRLNCGISAAHPLGCDQLGRDLLSRVIYGARTSLSLATLIQGIHLAIGGLVGVLAGYRGGWVDSALMRFTDAMYVFPEFLFLLVVAAVLGPGYWHIVLALGVVGWVGLARLVRGQVLAVKENDYVPAAVALGGTRTRVLSRHVLPNSLGPVIVAVALGIPRLIFAEAFVNFLGVGIRPPTPDWGFMVSDAYNVLLGYPREVLVPTLAIALASLAFQLLGDGLRDALDPRLAPGGRRGGLGKRW